MSIPANPWDRVLVLLRDEVSLYQYITWFKPMKPVLTEPDRMMILVEDKFVASILKTRYYELVKHAIAIVYGREIEIDFRPEDIIPHDE